MADFHICISVRLTKPFTVEMYSLISCIPIPTNRFTQKWEMGLFSKSCDNYLYNLILFNLDNYL